MPSPPYALDGVWFHVVNKLFEQQCCDCGKVHKWEYKKDKRGRLWAKGTFSARATAAARRGKKLKLLSDN